MENSIKEAVKTMEHWIEYEKNNKEKINKADELINIQETILSDYKKILKENEELKNQEETARKVNELLVERYSTSIPVQKVKDKIRKNEEIIDISNDGDLIHELLQKNKVYEELLESEMNKEEKKALKVINARTRRLLDELEIEKEDMSDEPRIAYLMQEIRANKTILNLIEKLQKENDKLNIKLDDKEAEIQILKDDIKADDIEYKHYKNYYKLQNKQKTVKFI